MLPKTTVLKDYKIPNYLIDHVDLSIELGEEETLVTAQLSVWKNPKAGETAHHLILEGADQKLLSLKINENALTASQYQLEENFLTLFNVPSQFLLEIKTAIKPQHNESLSGLYQSRHIFCTQCESEGFRRITYFLDRPDILSQYSVRIVADKKKYPILLSNGELVESGDLAEGLHWFKWVDPHPKPCYLFAMVAGNLDFIEDYFKTMSGKNVTLRIFCEPGDREKCRYAMSSLKKAMRWDEEKYGREYDLNIFMIVAVHDFNFGAMENKGLNIFNAKYILADPTTATDLDYSNIDGIVAHEYFHNWSGNRVTCRDWFQICLKEGFTVFRDQEFSADIGSRAVHRINEVQILRESQFPEDAGPLAHSIRPESYIEINNFYTTTVYRKGAEVIRMLHTLLGEVNFRKATDLYFTRHDGQAVTCEDFIIAMEDASGVDLTQFRLWYQQAGTPILYLASKYHEEEAEWHLAVTQACSSAPGQPENSPMQIPLALGLLNSEGQEMTLQLKGEKKGKGGTKVLNITKEEELFIFENIHEKPVPSFLRHFSAPVLMEYQYRNKELAFLMAHDSDAFMRWEASQIYALRILNQLVSASRERKELNLPEDCCEAFKEVLSDDQLDRALMAKIFYLPTEQSIGAKQPVIDIENNHAARRFMHHAFAEKFTQDFLSIYYANSSEKPYEYHASDSAKRSLKNGCLIYLTDLATEEFYALALKQFNQADNMTDKIAALFALNNHSSPVREEMLNSFYHEWQNNPLVMDKWFAVQATSSLPDTLTKVEGLLAHPKFDLKNPNRVYALLVNFSRQNPARFHDVSGRAYQLLADKIIEIDLFNSHVAARLIEPLTQWKRHDERRRELMRAQLERILIVPKISKAVYELASKSCG